ncbi:hypothetical protein ADUPG1_008147 [Aduncisulcus paluster]|uniref:Protein kinase domain-containing protein n=1 Tax=Aduncisulcus paluster TaxID=2918883 RepID=A0ABQ5KQX7_9EUKA|nr:hypothetical protein ADUPG1_008147 [Aduncisulcus paluster]
MLNCIIYILNGFNYGTKKEDGKGYDQSSNAQAMMKRDFNRGQFTHISIPFSTASPIKGIYICLFGHSSDSPPSFLIFTFTSSEGEKISKRCNFDSFDPDAKYRRWYRLPIDLSDIILCEITGKGRKQEYFNILNLVFFREETSEETVVRKAQEKLWSEATVVKPEFIKEGGKDDIPIPRDHPKLVNPYFSMVKGKNDSYGKVSKEYDQSYQAQKMLKGDALVCLSHLSIPFSSPCPMKGAYICVEEPHGSPSLLLTFTDCDGKKTSKKYEFPIWPKHGFEWYFLPIDLSNIVLCEIQGKGMWREKQSRCFWLNSLVFLRDDISSLPLSFFPSSSSKKPVSELSLELAKGEKEKGGSSKHDSLTLTSASTITPQCIIGSGGFGEVLLVKVDGIPFPCVLKKMLQIADKTVVKGCRKEFKVQLKLFTNPKCFNRIPRPLYILDLLDCDMKGVYGFLMEFCVGGSVSAFAKRWCADGKYVSVDDTADDSEPSDSDSLYPSTHANDSVVDTAVLEINPMTLNPVKVCSLCVGMIECLDDVFTAKPMLVHRDVKPDNFLVRVDPKDGECSVVLADLGFVQIQDSVSSSTSSQQIDSSISTKVDSSGKKETEQAIGSNCGTLVYNAFETLTEGLQTQSSDAYSLGLSILSLFTCLPPFLGHPGLRGIIDRLQFMTMLSDLIKTGMSPKLSSSPLFKTLLTIDDGMYEPIHKVLNEVFTGLTFPDADKRMSVHQASVKVQSIKPFLPKIGEGYECPNIDDIIREQRKKYGGSVGIIEGMRCGVVGVEHEEGWDQSL